MSEKKISSTIRPLFQIEPGLPELEEVTQQEITNRKQEAKRVVKRLFAIIKEHRDASLGLNVTIGEAEILIVTEALRDHAKGGEGALKIDSKDEIYTHCLNRLFEELVEEPSNILYATPTSPTSTRYDAMNVPFWIECLDYLEEEAASIGKS